MNFTFPGDVDDIGLRATHLNASFRDRQELREKVCDFFKQRRFKNPGFSGVSVVKYLPANARDGGSIPRSERCPREGNGNPFLTWEIPWRQEPEGLQSMGSQRVSHH